MVREAKSRVMENRNSCCSDLPQPSHPEHFAGTSRNSHLKMVRKPNNDGRNTCSGTCSVNSPKPKHTDRVGEQNTPQPRRCVCVPDADRLHACIAPLARRPRQGNHDPSKGRGEGFFFDRGLLRGAPPFFGDIELWDILFPLKPSHIRLKPPGNGEDLMPIGAEVLPALPRVERFPEMPDAQLYFQLAEAVRRTTRELQSANPKNQAGDCPGASSATYRAGRSGFAADCGSWRRSGRCRRDVTGGTPYARRQCRAFA